MIEFNAKLEKFEASLWQYHIIVPNDIAKQFIEGTNRRVICFLNNNFECQTALMPSGEGWFIKVNKEIRDKLMLDVGEVVSVSIKKDVSEYGMDMPEELAILFEQDETGWAYFNELTIGKKRSLLYIINKVKNTNSRINKALAIVQHLNERKGKLDFKMLNELIKHYNANR